MANRHTIQDLQYLQALPLDLKVKLTKQRIREWINHFGEDGVYISFSGGKDSTVLLDIVRESYPNVTAMFVDVPTQYPELREFVKTFDNVDIVRPKMNFFEVCKKYGFPLMSKEVSECVQGARKYLTSLKQDENILTDRQTDRQTDHTSIGMTEYADWASMQSPSRGGHDNKYRKLRAIGEYSKRSDGTSKGWQQSEIGNNVGDTDKGQESSGKGEYP